MDGLSREAGSPVPHYLCTPACADCCALIVAASSHGILYSSTIIQGSMV